MACTVALDMLKLSGPDPADSAGKTELGESPEVTTSLILMEDVGKFAASSDRKELLICSRTGYRLE